MKVGRDCRGGSGKNMGRSETCIQLKHIVWKLESRLRDSEYLSSILRTQMVVHSLRGWNILFWPLQALQVCDTQTKMQLKHSYT